MRSVHGMSKLTSTHGFVQNKMLVALDVAEKAVKSGHDGQDVAHRLINESKDIVAASLDEKVL